MPSRENNLCGTAAPITEAVMDAVREVRGRRPVRPALTVEAATAEVRDFVVVAEWYAGETAAVVAAEVLRSLHNVDATGSPLSWALYTEGARRLGFGGAVPVPALTSSDG